MDEFLARLHDDPEVFVYPDKEPRSSSKVLEGVEKHIERAGATPVGRSQIAVGMWSQQDTEWLGEKGQSTKYVLRFLYPGGPLDDIIIVIR